MFRTFITFTFLLFLPMFSWAQITDVPPDIERLIQKDPKALTEIEKNQINNFIGSGPALPTIATPDNTSNCFDYYHFGSVQVDVSPILNQTIPGTELSFTGFLKNENAYPIVNGQIYMKIFKKGESNESLVRANGYPLVDFVLIKDNLTLKAGANLPIGFNWQVPNNIAGGEYEAAFYFTTAHRFNLLGLTFTDDVTGNKAPFSITAENNQVVFDKNSVKFNNTDFRFAAFPPHFAKNETVNAQVAIVNPSKEDKVVTLTWTTYKWDGILEANKIISETTGIALKPGESKLVSYLPPVINSAVTFIEAVVVDGDAKSMLNIRFVRDDSEEVRINFPSITKYPLIAGEEAILFSCLHSTNLPLVSDNELRLILRDQNGNVVHSYNYIGAVTGEMMGVKDSFIPKTKLTSFSLTATLINKGQVVDEVIQVYSCDDLGEVCVNDTNSIEPESTVSSENKNSFILFITLVLIVAFITVYYFRRKGVDNIIYNQDSDI